jgi:hypothetical protein
MSVSWRKRVYIQNGRLLGQMSEMGMLRQLRKRIASEMEIPAKRIVN